MGRPDWKAGKLPPSPVSLLCKWLPFSVLCPMSSISVMVTPSLCRKPQHLCILALFWRSVFNLPILLSHTETFRHFTLKISPSSSKTCFPHIPFIPSPFQKDWFVFILPMLPAHLFLPSHHVTSGDGGFSFFFPTYGNIMIIILSLISFLIFLSFFKFHSSHLILDNLIMDNPHSIIQTSIIIILSLFPPSILLAYLPSPSIQVQSNNQTINLLLSDPLYLLLWRRLGPLPSDHGVSLPTCHDKNSKWRGSEGDGLLLSRSRTNLRPGFLSERRREREKKGMKAKAYGINHHVSVGIGRQCVSCKHLWQHGCFPASSSMPDWHFFFLHCTTHPPSLLRAGSLCQPSHPARRGISVCHHGEERRGEGEPPSH